MVCSKHADNPRYDDRSLVKPIADGEDKLFEEWERVSGAKARFVRDGAVDPFAYEGSRPRVLFVLKEANDRGGGGWDLREYLRDGGRGPTWNNIARWTKGITALPEVHPWRILEDINEDARKCILRGIAAVNLKKVPGGSTAKFSEIQRFARDNGEFIQRQLDLYKPDYIVGCGQDVAEILFGDVYEKRPDWKVTSKGIWHASFNRARYFDYWHPNARWPANLLHHGLIDAVLEVESLG